MGCKRPTSGGCVSDIVEKIALAQSEIFNDDCCEVSCERGIDELLGGVPVTTPDKDTLPFLLYCEGSCKPFFATSVRNTTDGFECIKSPFFRVKKIIDDKENCAVLELLLPVGNGNGSQSGCSDSCHEEVCDFFEGRTLRNFQRTKLCVTVDLDCFCAISCLPAVRAVMADM